MHKHKRRDEGVSNKAPNARSRLHNEVRDEFAKAVQMFMMIENFLYTQQTQRYKDVGKFR